MIPICKLSYKQIHALFLLSEWCALHKIPPFDKGLEKEDFHNPMDIYPTGMIWHIFLATCQRA